MYKPQPKEEPSAQSNRQKLPPESGCPSMGKVKFMIEEATSRRGCLVELPWSVGEAAFVLTCQWEKIVDEPVWTLYEQENGVASKVVWTQSFAPGDLEFMYDILVMSAPKNSSLAHSQIPDLLKPEHQEEDNSWSGPAPEPGGYSGATSGIGISPVLPGAGLPGAGLPGALPSTGLPGAGLPGAGMPGAGLPGGLPGAGLPGGGMPAGVPGAVPGGPGASYQNLPNVPPMPYGNQPPQSISGQNQQYQGGYQPPMGGYPGAQPPMPSAGYGGYPPPQGQTGGQYPYGQQMPPMPAPAYPPQPAYAPAPMPAPAPVPQEPMTKMIDYHLLDKRKNLLLGTMLTGAGLISEPTLEAALKLQDLIRDERMSPERAPHVLKRLHAMGANIDQYLTPDDTSLEPPSLTGAPTPAKKPAPAAGKPAGGAPPAPGAAPGGGPAGAKRNLKPAFDLLQTAGILSEEDIKVALEVRKKHGGDLVGILEAASKVSRKTVDAAFICLPLIREGLLKVEQCIIALNYCSRMRVGFDEALDEMGWQNPRKMRSDLPL